MNIEDITNRFNNILKRHSAINLLTGFMMGIGIRHAINRRDYCDLILATFAPGFYCGFTFFNILNSEK